MRSRIFLVTGCVLLLVAAVSLAQAEGGAGEGDGAESVKKAAERAAGEEAKAPPERKAPIPLALTTEAIQELADRKAALDLRERQLADRARDLDLQEKLLREKLKKMEELSRKMAERLDAYKKDHEERIAKLVTVVQGMRPEAAARYVENLDPSLAVEILARIKEERASKILNLMDKKMGARLTELYAGYRESVEEPKAPEPATSPAGREAQPAGKPM